MNMYFDFVEWICNLFLLIHLLIFFKSSFKLEMRSLMLLDDAKNFSMVENADRGLRTTDFGKDRVARVQLYFDLNFNINFCFLCQNMYFEHNMEYQKLFFNKL